MCICINRKNRFPDPVKTGYFFMLGGYVVTIKGIKEKYRTAPEYMLPGKRQFTVWTFPEPIGKSVVMVINCGKFCGNYVEAIIPVKTGIDILNGNTRPCDNMEDAIDVAGEMISDNWDDLRLKEVLS